MEPAYLLHIILFFYIKLIIVSDLNFKHIFNVSFYASHALNNYLMHFKIVVPMNGKTTSIIGALGIIAAAALILSNSEYILGLLSSSLRINTSGMVTSVNLEVYWDSACTNKVTSIDWGIIPPGGSAAKTVYIKNIGNVPITLSLNTENWNPPGAANYLTLTWNYTSGTKIQPNNVLPVTLTLTVSSSIQGIDSFSFNIVITGTESQ